MLRLSVADMGNFCDLYHNLLAFVRRRSTGSTLAAALVIELDVVLVLPCLSPSANAVDDKSARLQILSLAFALMLSQTTTIAHVSSG